MLTRQTRDPLAQKTEPKPFAARAKDLGAMRDAVVDAANVGAGFWLSYLFALFYFGIAAGAVTHRDLLLESPVKLPFLNVELPLKAFFVLGPLVFLIVHVYVLLHFVLLAGKIGAFDLELQAQISGKDARARLRGQLPSNIFVQSLAGPREVRNSPVGLLLRLIIEISLVVGPIALLILFQLQFLPYHSEWITWWQRIALLIDLVLLWILWPRITREGNTGLGSGDFRRVKVQVLLVGSIVPVLLVITVATFPGEWLEENLPPVRVIPTTWAALTLSSVRTIQLAASLQRENPEVAAVALAATGWAAPHELLVAGRVNYVTGRPQSLWSNVLVLPNFEVGDRANFDVQGKVAISSDSLSLRGRSLEGAVLVFAHLRKADFTGASLVGAKFNGADLREAKFESIYPSGEDSPWFGVGVACNKEIACTQLQGADFSRAHLQGALLRGARLQGANLSYTQLQGANLNEAQLQGASLLNAHMQGASLERAELQGASLVLGSMEGADLDSAQLQGAALNAADLEGADFSFAQLQGADLFNTALQGALLRNAYVWRTNLVVKSPTDAFVDKLEPGPIYNSMTPPSSSCPHTGGCDWSERDYQTLKSLIENTVPLGPMRWRALKQIGTLQQPPYVPDEGSAKAWTDLAGESARSAGSYFDTLAKYSKRSAAPLTEPPT
jgi:uncharacterized protein YjbI with pentapeptide repeats